MASLPTPTATLITNVCNTNQSKLKASPKFEQTHLALSSGHAGNPPKNVTRSCELHKLSCLCKEGRIQEAIASFNDMERKNVEIGPEVYGDILQACVDEQDLSTGSQIHARIVKNGELFSRNEYLETKVVIFYAKCDVLDMVDAMFCRMKVKNEFAWAAVIGLYCKDGFFVKALMGHCEMLENGIFADNFVVPNVLKACGSLMWIGFGKGVHGYALKMGFGQCVYVASSLVDMYGKCGVLEDARKVFDEMCERNVIFWNSMIVGYVQNGRNEEALGMFYEMRLEGVEPTRVTVSSFLSAAAILGAVDEGKQGHAIAVLGGLDLDEILGTSIINFYVKCGLIEDAELVFKRMVYKDVVTWNLLISGHVQYGLVETAINMCRRMNSENLRYDSVTLASILSTAAKKNDFKLGKEAHCYCIRNNLESYVVVANNIIEMYSVCDRIGSARHVFDNAAQIDLVMWNTLIASYAKLGLSCEASKLFYQMQLENVLPNVISWNSLIHSFLRKGQVDEARELFSQMERYGTLPNHLTWTTLISGLGNNGFYNEAIEIFLQMQDSGIKPNVVTIVSALSACRGSALLHYGRAIHGYVLRHYLSDFSEIATSILDMYAKSGRADEAWKYYHTVMMKDLAIYNTMISCNAVYGRAHEALKLYKSLQLDGLEPDDVTFTSILSACSHSCLVDEVMDILDEMTNKYHVQPSIQHYGCVVGLLCRCGHLEEALRVVLNMPYEPDAHILGSLVTACREQREIELSESLLEHMIDLEPGNPGNYVALSNMYAAVERWDRVSETRNVMREKRLTKNPGCSWVQIGAASHVFVAGDKSHEEIMKVHKMLALLGIEMESTGSAY